MTDFHGSEQTYKLKLGRNLDHVMQQQRKCIEHSVPEWSNLAITTPLRNLKQVLQEVGLLLVEQLFAGGVHICSDWLVSIEGTNVYLANLHTAQCYRYKSRQ